MAKEYIEREQAISVRPEYLNPFKSEYNKGWNDCLNTVFESIKSLPAADVQEVRHGENITSMHPTDEFICSECGIVFHDVSEYIVEDDVYREFYFDYCPKCGAKMDKEYGKK